MWVRRPLLDEHEPLVVRCDVVHSNLKASALSLE